MKIALMSDSIGQAPYYYGNENGNDDAVRKRGETWISTASIASKGLIRIGLNVAIAGNTTQQMLERIDTDLGTKLNQWDTITICGGVNDTLLTPIQTVSNIEAMAIKALQWGKNVIFCTLFPANTHEARTRIRKINYLVCQLSAKYHAPLVDFHNHFLDPVTAGWKEGFYADSLHPNLAGVNEAGKYFAEKIIPFLQPAQPFIALDNLDTRVMVNGNFNPNPLWLTDSDADGIPDGYSRSVNPGGYTYEFAKNVAFDADAVRCKVVGVEAATGPFSINMSFGTTKWAVGEVCQVALRVKFTPGVEGATTPKFLMKIVAVGSTEGFGFQQVLLGNHDGVIVSEPFTIPAGTTNVVHRMEVVGGALEAEFSRPTLINLTKQGMI
ncbi:MAG: SGNH/GDSL hydrolase family protein [Bacillota bacterium]